MNVPESLVSNSGYFEIFPGYLPGSAIITLEGKSFAGATLRDRTGDLLMGNIENVRHKDITSRRRTKKGDASYVNAPGFIVTYL